jgi:ubiquitin-protein ligase
MWSGVQACNKAAFVTPATQRRLLADLKRLQEEPIPLASAKPCSDQDLILWDGVIGVEMEVTHFGLVTVPLHFLIDFPSDYPQSAPNIGFSFEFEYRGGAQYVMPDGRLKGKKVICLDVLGNFGTIHREWKNSVGSGWSPAYTVTTLLVQLQSVLCDLGNAMSHKERDITYQSAVRFCENNPVAVLELLDEDDIREKQEQRRIAACTAKIQKICHGDSTLSDRVQEFVKRACLSDDVAKLEMFLALLTDVAKKRPDSNSTWMESDSLACSDREVEVDRNICCFATGKLYTETLLGVGVARVRNNLGTAGELLSKEAFDNGFRHNTDKSAFEFFLPVWINETHAAKCEAWCRILKESYTQIGRNAYQVSDEDDCIIEVFPRLINQMIVEIMRPDAAKSAAIATFEAMCNFWRMLRWLVDTRPNLLSRITSMLSKFILDESCRHKDKTPDLGVALVLFTAVQGHENCPTRDDFVKAYADENSLRWVMWWQRAGTKPEPIPVFQATQVSREILIFQLMVVDIMISDVKRTLREIEESNCKLPQRLEDLQARWRQHKSSIDCWASYFACIGAPQPSFQSEAAWIADCVKRAEAKGPKYAGTKGEGKGDKGKGKGGSKNGNKGWVRR